MADLRRYVARFNSTTQSVELRARGRTTLTYATTPPAPPPLSVVLTSSSTSVQSGATITLTATASGGVTPYSYVFKDPSGAVIAGTLNTRTLVATLTGTYTVTVTDATTPTVQTATAPVSISVSSTRMTNPAGTALLSDLTRIANWVYVEPGSTIVELAGQTGPSGDVIIRNTCVDGQTNTPSGVPSERSDMSGPDVPLNQTRWMIWDERIMQLPAVIFDRWQILGPCEIHDVTGLPQALVMPEVDPNHRRRLNANAGSINARYFDIGPIVIGQWYQCKFGVYYTQASNGWIEFWRDGVRVVRIDGPTTGENDSGYWKFGNYRDAGISGTTQIDVSGCRVYG